MTAKTQIQIVPEPMPLICHKLWMQTRLVDINQAIARYEHKDVNKPVPECWREELEALKIEIELETTS